jgi:hypothetical protein
MTDRVIPIALTNVAWQQYLTICKDILGHSVSRGVDSSTSKLSDYAKYVASLAEFQAGAEYPVKDALRRFGPHLHHIFVSFIVLSSNSVILQISEGSDLSVLSTKAEKQRLAIISGNLEEWRNAVVTFCVKEYSSRLRHIFNEIYFCFKQLGLEDVWKDYRSEKQKDETFYLTYDP